MRTPSGRQLDLRSIELQGEIAERLGSNVELMMLKHGIFDVSPVSLIGLATIARIGDEAGVDLDRRRFRANILVETRDSEPFLEDDWVGGTLVFGNSERRPAVAVTARDLRCVIVNLDPDTSAKHARVMKTIGRLNENTAGVYGTVVQTGTIRVGDPVSIVVDARR